MNSLIIPEFTPPQISEDARYAVLNSVLENGVISTAAKGLGVLEAEHAPLAEYLDELGSKLDDYADEYHWPSRILKISSSLSMLAYRETGFYQEVQADAVDYGAEIAENLGVPDAYAISYQLDVGLIALYDDLETIPQISEQSPGWLNLDSRQQGGFRQVWNIGGGCVRHFLQQAL